MDCINKKNWCLLCSVLLLISSSFIRCQKSKYDTQDELIYTAWQCVSKEACWYYSKYTDKQLLDDYTEIKKCSPDGKQILCPPAIIGDQFCQKVKNLNGSECISKSDCWHYAQLTGRLPGYEHDIPCSYSNKMCCPPRGTIMCGNSTKKSPSNNESRVEVTSAHEFPWHVALYDSDNSLYPSCGASIISSEYLITAAHCFRNAFQGDTLNNEKLSNYYMMVGKINVRNDAKNRHRIKIKRVFFMSDYFRGNLTHQNDIAIIWMDHKITYNESVLPICLINEYFPYIPKDEAPLMAAVSGRSNSRRENLISVTTWFHSYQECINERNYTYFSPKNFCTKTKTGKRDFQSGDAGSGLVMKGPNDVYYLIGIVSFGWEKDTFPTICTYVPLFHHWILETVHSNEIKSHGTHN